jgi:O-antigen biosynthesis protein
MVACGLPVVDLDTDAARQTYGDAVACAAAEPLALADAVERLLDDLLERGDRVRLGLAHAQARTPQRAAEQLEAALRGRQT